VRVKHKPDFCNALACEFYSVKIDAKNQKGGFYVSHRVYHEIRTPDHGAEQILYVIMHPPHTLQNF
jgi:hypothetical protein